MAVGDVASVVPQALANDATYSITPSAGVEWVVHNVYSPTGSAVELYWSDGVNDIKVDANTGGWLGYFFHVTSARYLKIKNVSGVQIYVAFDGIQTK